MKPSIPQMRARSNSGHRQALQALADGRPVLWPRAQGGEIRGMTTVLRTLSRWGCVEDGQLTDRGRSLLEALR